MNRHSFGRIQLGSTKVFPSPSLHQLWYLHGCFPLWLGCTHRPMLNVGLVVPRPIPPAHQRSGIGSGQPGHLLLPLHFSAFFSDTLSRQHHSSGPCQQTGGGGEILLSVHQGGTTPDMVSQPWHYSLSSPCGRQSECLANQLSRFHVR